MSAAGNTTPIFVLLYTDHLIRLLATDPAGILGVQAYLERMVATLAPIPAPTANGAEQAESLHAAHIFQGNPRALVSWTGHRIMTWEPAANFNPFPIPLDGLTVDNGDQPVVQATALNGFGMSVGKLRSLSCCDRCKEKGDGFDYRLFVDPTVVGSVCALQYHLRCSY